MFTGLWPVDLLAHQWLTLFAALTYSEGLSSTASTQWCYNLGCSQGVGWITPALINVVCQSHAREFLMLLDSVVIVLPIYDVV